MNQRTIHGWGTQVLVNTWLENALATKRYGFEFPASGMQKKGEGYATAEGAAASSASSLLPTSAAAWASTRW
jgi:hypothetical protein